MNIIIPASVVCSTSLGLNGPGPTEVYALTLILYSTNSCKSVRVMSVMGTATNVEFSEISPPNVISGVYPTSYWMIIPFWSISGTGSQVTRISVDEIVETATF